MMGGGLTHVNDRSCLKFVLNSNSFDQFSEQYKNSDKQCLHVTNIQKRCYDFVPHEGHSSLHRGRFKRRIASAENFFQSIAGCFVRKDLSRALCNKTTGFDWG